MKDKGINLGHVQEFNTSDKRKKGVFWGFRKMFWDYLNKLNVPFFDPCCEDSATMTGPVRYNPALERLEYYNGTAWVDIVSINETTSTTTSSTSTTTSSSTTSTTTVEPTTSTTTTTTTP